MFLNLKKGFQDHKVAPWLQKWSKMTKSIIIQKAAVSALAGDPTAVRLAIDHSVFIKTVSMGLHPDLFCQKYPGIG